MRTEGPDDKKTYLDIEIDLSYIAEERRLWKVIATNSLILNRPLTEKEINSLDDQLSEFFIDFFDKTEIKIVSSGI